MNSFAIFLQRYIAVSIVLLAAALCMSVSANTANHIHNASVDNILTVTAVGSDYELDTRYMFESDVVKLALEKTVAEFGPFNLQFAPSMTHSRAIRAIRSNTHTNFIRSFGYENSLVLDNNMVFIPFPIFRGIIGLRTCFLSRDIQQKFADVKTKQDLLAYSHGQGLGWADGAILAANGFTTYEIPDYFSLFKMAALNRFDLFCRGANEVMEEFKRFGNIKGLAYDRSKVLYYPMPHFLFTNKNNTKTTVRITRGLMLAVKDGSYDRLWKKYHDSTMAFVDINNRILIKLENPQMKNLNVQYEQYFYPPLLELLSKHTP